MWPSYGESRWRNDGRSRIARWSVSPIQYRKRLRMTRFSLGLLNQLRVYWFLLGLALVVTIGLVGHSPLQTLTQFSWLMSGLAFAVMAMMAAPIPLEMVRQTVGRPWPAVLASMINLAVVPLLGWVASQWLPLELAGGLIVASAVPSTLTSAAVLARKAGGDDSVCIFATLITNISCVVITPFWMIVLLGVSVQLSMLDMIANLSLIVLLPIAMVQLLRYRSQKFCRLADRSRIQLSVLCQLGILIMVLMGSVQMGVRWSSQESQGRPIEVWQVVIVIFLGLLVHLAAFYISWVVARRTGISRTQAKAVSFSGSQKTLMIGLNLAIQCGVNILPMVTYHIFQLVVDAIIAEKWSRQEKTSKN